MFGGELATVIFGLVSAISWGAGDFTGGLATKRTPVFAVLVISYAVDFLLSCTLAFLWGEPLPPIADLGWGVAAGLAGVVGVAALYRALAIGRMGIVAPVSAVLTAGLPALFGILTEGLPESLTLVGFGLALIGIWLIAGTDTSVGARDGLGLAVLAGCGFGVLFILMNRAGEHALFWPLVAARLGSLAVVLPIAFARRQVVLPERSLLVTIVLSGALNVAGNVFFVLASQAGRLDVAAILASLYPASTVLLATTLLRERMMRVQVIGLVAALAAIALIAS